VQATLAGFESIPCISLGLNPFPVFLYDFRPVSIPPNYERVAKLTGAADLHVAELVS
jgi:hypothetical protein